MKYLDLKIFVIFSIVVLALASITVPTKYQQGFYTVDEYVMPEPFSSGPLITNSMNTTKAEY